MRTGLVRGSGEKKRVEDYIAESVQYLRCPESVQDTAVKMHHFMAKNTSFLGLSPSMRGMTLVNLAAKHTVAVLSKDTPLADRKNILYTVTTVTYGRGKAVVFSTSMNTELGKVAAAVQAIDVQKTPFELKIRQTAKMLSIIMLA